MLYNHKYKKVEIMEKQIYRSRLNLNSMSLRWILSHLDTHGFLAIIFQNTINVLSP